MIVAFLLRYFPNLFLMHMPKKLSDNLFALLLAVAKIVGRHITGGDEGVLVHDCSFILSIKSRDNLLIMQKEDFSIITATPSS